MEKALENFQMKPSTIENPAKFKPTLPIRKVGFFIVEFLL